MEILLKNIEQVTVVTPVGSIDALTAEEVTAILAGQTSQGKKNLVLDFSKVEFMSSAGLRAILAALKDCRSMGGDLRIAATQPGVEKVLKLSGFTTILKTYLVVDQAVQSFA